MQQLSKFNMVLWLLLLLFVIVVGPSLLPSPPASSKNLVELCRRPAGPVQSLWP
ncbi:MAG: hypothetical protein U5L11_15750 [Arhodomonas sp.]|nr:hypothetical protein [Arhodomonas sp.]